jgi:hypothetical protein
MVLGNFSRRSVGRTRQEVLHKHSTTTWICSLCPAPLGWSDGSTASGSETHANLFKSMPRVLVFRVGCGAYVDKRCLLRQSRFFCSRLHSQAS